MMGVELGKIVMSLDMGPLGVLQLYSHAGNQGPSWLDVENAFFPLANLLLWSVHSQLGPGLAG